MKFIPILKDKIWGGNKLSKMLGKGDGSLKNIGESWEISGVDNSESVVLNGFLKGNTINELIEVYMGDIVGEKIFRRYGNQFPLLFKFIDANADLSIQVHPNDEIAMERHDSYGKTEMWFVMQADDGAKLVSGFKSDITCESYLECLKNKQLDKILGYTDVNEGDVLYIPAGRVHAIGAGVLVAEIQQSSDITYRIFDYDRKDSFGNYRQLHTDDALDVIDYSKNENPKILYHLKKNESNELVKCEYFTVNIIDLNDCLEKDYYEIDSFIVYMCVDGGCNVLTDNNDPVFLKKGDTIFIPNECNRVVIEPTPSVKLLEVYI